MQMSYQYIYSYFLFSRWNLHISSMLNLWDILWKGKVIKIPADQIIMTSSWRADLPEAGQ